MDSAGIAPTIFSLRTAMKTPDFSSSFCFIQATVDFIFVKCEHLRFAHRLSAFKNINRYGAILAVIAHGCFRLNLSEKAYDFVHLHNVLYSQILQNLVGLALNSPSFICVITAFASLSES